MLYPLFILMAVICMEAIKATCEKYDFHEWSSAAWGSVC